MPSWLVTYKRDEVRELAIEAPTMDAAMKIFDSMSLAPAGRLVDWQQDRAEAAIWEPLKSDEPEAPIDHPSLFKEGSRFG